MSTHTSIGIMQYASGDWYVIAKENGFVLLPGHMAASTLERVWRALDSGRIAAVIDAMTATAGAPLSAVPPFAIAIGHGPDLRVAVRGDVRVVYDDGARQELITGGRMETWVEQELPVHVALLVTPPESQIDETLLPLISGIARAGLVAVGTQDHPAGSTVAAAPVGATTDAAAIDAPEPTGADEDERADDEPETAAAEGGSAGEDPTDDRTRDDGVDTESAADDSVVDDSVVENGVVNDSVVDSSVVYDGAPANEGVITDHGAVADHGSHADDGAHADGDSDPLSDGEDAVSDEAVDNNDVHNNDAHSDGVHSDDAHTDGVHNDGVHSDGVHNEGVDNSRDFSATGDIARRIATDSLAEGDDRAGFGNSGGPHGDLAHQAGAADRGDDAISHDGTHPTDANSADEEPSDQTVTGEAVIDPGVTGGTAMSLHWSEAEPDSPAGQHSMAAAGITGDHDGHTVEQSFLDAARAAGLVSDTDPGAATAADFEDAPDFYAEFGIDLDGTHTSGEAGGSPDGDRATRGRVVLSTGAVLDLDRTLIVGRRPRIEQGMSDDIPELITVASPTHDISRNHVEIRRDGEAVTVTDLNTTNGTMLLREGDGPLRLHPGEATMVLSGDVLDIGDDVTLRFEDIP